MAILCVLSHGDEGVVFGSDGRPLPVNDIIKELDNDYCINVAGKPKLIIIQACRGGRLFHVITTIN